MFFGLFKTSNTKELEKELARLKRYDWVNLLANPPSDEDFYEDDIQVEFSDGRDIWQDYWTEWMKAIKQGATHWRIIYLPNNNVNASSAKM
jgi:hypothetical protein